jgi:xanthosine utilization system XapX-like protein
MNKRFAVNSTLLCTMVMGAAVGFAQAPKQVPVNFRPGKSSAVLVGRLVGDQAIDYVLTVKAGQKVSVTLTKAKSSAGYLVIDAGTGNGMADSNLAGTRANVVAVTDGKVKVRLFMVRAAARRGESSPFSLTISVTGKALAPVKGDALVKGTNFHATAEAQMDHYLFKDMKTCKVGVIRRGENATGTLEFSFNGQKRRVLIVAGKAVSADSTEKVSSSKEGETFVIKIGASETYKVNELLLMGD